MTTDVCAWCGEPIAPYQWFFVDRVEGEPLFFDTWHMSCEFPDGKDVES